MPDNIIYRVKIWTAYEGDIEYECDGTRPGALIRALELSREKPGVRVNVKQDACVAYARDGALTTL